MKHRKIMDLLYLKSLVEAFVSGAISETDFRRSFVHIFKTPNPDVAVAPPSDRIPDETI